MICDGIIRFRPTTYIVGQQWRGRESGYAFAPSPLINLFGCNRTLLIQGNGARLRCAEGLRYGTFDPTSGKPTKHEQPYYGSGQLASPYRAMIQIASCSAEVGIRDLELDGNLVGLQVGGPWGDTGWQIGCIGLLLKNNLGREHITGVHSHHHGQDGFQIDGPSIRRSLSLFENCESDYNARQGCSIVGGRNYTFRNSRFRHTGKGGLMSAPGAGVDIEAEGEKTVRDLKFESCEFSNNSGVGLLAEEGNSEGAIFNECRFVGTASWGAWPNKPSFVFTNCKFVGSIANAHGDPD